MSTFFIKSNGRGLFPSNIAAQIQMEKLPKGATLRAVVTAPRNLRQLRLFWAFATLVADALNDGPTGKTWSQDDVATLFKIATGHVDMLPLAKKDALRLGITHAAIPQSISFAKMDGQDFGRFMNTSFEYVRDTVCPWIIDSEHWREIEIILAQSGMVDDPGQPPAKEANAAPDADLSASGAKNDNQPKEETDEH